MPCMPASTAGVAVCHQFWRGGGGGMVPHTRPQTDNILFRKKKNNTHMASAMSRLDIREWKNRYIYSMFYTAAEVLRCRSVCQYIQGFRLYFMGLSSCCMGKSDKTWNRTPFTPPPFESVKYTKNTRYDSPPWRPRMHAQALANCVMYWLHPRFSILMVFRH